MEETRSKDVNPELVTRDFKELFIQSKQPEGKVRVALSCTLHLIDPLSSSTIPISPSDSLTCSIIKTPVESKSWLSIINNKTKKSIQQEIHSGIHPTFSTPKSSFVWVYHSEDGHQTLSLSISFLDNLSFSTFRPEFIQCLYDGSHEDSFDELQIADQEHYESVYEEDIKMTDVIDDDNSNDDSDSDSSDGSDGSDDEEKVSGFAPITESDGGKNSQLAVGFKNDRSFVVRGSKIGVYHPDPDNPYALRFSTTINNVQTLDGKLFSPQKIMLHNQDHDLLMIKSDDRHHVYKMDLELSQVVEKWKIDDKITIDNMIPEKKYSQLTNTQTLIGFNESSLYRLDPRVAGNKRVDKDTTTYAAKTRFSCGTTTGNGELAIGSKKGDIRLYNKLNVRAKTHLPGLGDPIKGIDTTENGKFIIATCKNYLLLINTELRDRDGITGFTKSMGSYKPAPKRLQIRPEHIALIGLEIDFTTAKFNTGENEEKTIVTSSGPYVIIWDFDKVKTGKINAHYLKESGQDKNIIVAFPDDVNMISKHQLKTPSRLIKRKNSLV